jgi:hypothetical protein
MENFTPMPSMTDTKDYPSLDWYSTCWVLLWTRRVSFYNLYVLVSTLSLFFFFFEREFIHTCWPEIHHRTNKTYCRDPSEVRLSRGHNFSYYWHIHGSCWAF